MLIDYDGNSSDAEKGQGNEMNNRQQSTIVQDIDSQLSYEDIWDDSELINAWNSSIEDYKKYHNRHGISEEILEEERKKPLPKWVRVESETTSSAPMNEKRKKDLMTTDIEEAILMKKRKLMEIQQRESESKSANQNASSNITCVANQHDQLQNVYWAWYMAGYHTGFYEVSLGESWYYDH